VLDRRNMKDDNRLRSIIPQKVFVAASAASRVTLPQCSCQCSFRQCDVSPLEHSASLRHSSQGLSMLHFPMMKIGDLSQMPCAAEVLPHQRAQACPWQGRKSRVEIRTHALGKAAHDGPSPAHRVRLSQHASAVNRLRHKGRDMMLVISDNLLVRIMETAWHGNEYIGSYAQKVTLGGRMRKRVHPLLQLPMLRWRCAC